MPRDRFPRAVVSSQAAVNGAVFDFWTAAAQRNPAFAPLYSARGQRPGMPVPSAEDRDWSPESTSRRISATSIEGAVANARKYGIALIEDFLPDAKYRLVREEFDALPDEPVSTLGSGVSLFESNPSPRFETIFADAVHDIASRIYGRGLHTRSRDTLLDRIVLNGKDTGDTNTLLHMDRFLPCIKIFYYPHAITDPDHSPFAYVPQSHIIDQEYRTCVAEYFAALSEGAAWPLVRNPTPNPECPVLTNGNTLLVAFTNGLHRRTPFGSGAPTGAYRESACFMFYNRYTGVSLLSNFLPGRHRSA